MNNKLIELLNNNDETQRMYAAQDMAESANPEYTPHLIGKLKAEISQAVRDTIVFALKTLSCESAYSELFGLFSSSSAYLRNAAIDIFASEKERSISFLESQMDHADGNIRKLILDALFNIGLPEAVWVIRKGMKDRSENVRITAVEYLGQLGDTDSIPEMVRLFDEESEPMLKVTILESLYLIADEKRLKAILLRLAPEGSLSQIDPLYIPQIVQLSSKADEQSLIRILEAVQTMNAYHDNVIRAVEQANFKYPEFSRRDEVQAIIRNIMAETDEAEILETCEKLIKEGGRG